MNKLLAGIGYSGERDSYKAGQDAARQALGKCAGGPGSLALAFCTGGHDPRACFAGIRSVVGEGVEVVGGAAAGLITAEHLGYGDYQVGIAVLPPDISCVVESSRLDRGEQKAGLALARALGPIRDGKGQLDLLFYETVRQAQRPFPKMNSSSYLLEGYREGAGENPTRVAGAGLAGNYDMGAGFQFLGRHVDSQSAVVAALQGDFEAWVTVMHGCKPMSDYHRITRVEGNVVCEIDGLPALDAVRDLLGHNQWEEHQPLLRITLGVNLGERHAPYDEKKYLNRMIVGYEPQERAVVLLEAGFRQGDEFRFMRRNEESTLQSVEKGCRDLRARLEQEKREAFFALYIDCMSRTAGFSGAQQEEAAIVQKAVGPDIPLLGFYSGVGIAPVMGVSRGLDWAGVLIVLSRGKTESGNQE